MYPSTRLSMINYQNSRIINDNYQTSRVINQQLSTSKVSKRMRSLSPQQAANMQNPTNKILIPTDHLWRVQGKQFSAVRIDVKEGPPIPPHLVILPRRINNIPITTQTVYQAIPRRSHVKSFNTTRSIAKLKTVFPPTPVTPIRTTFTPIPSQTIISIIPKQVSPVLAEYHPPQHPLYKQKKIQPINSINNKNRQKQQIKQISKQYDQQYYNNKMSNVTQVSGKDKKKYKYNCFSSIDQPINNHCGSCGSNQIIASKPFSSWE